MAICTPTLACNGQVSIASPLIGDDGLLLCHRAFSHASPPLPAFPAVAKVGSPLRNGWDCCSCQAGMGDFQVVNWF